MIAHMCIDCDSPGDGNCSACHGTGKIAGESFYAASTGYENDLSCSACGGSGHCQKCGGTGEIEVGGEG